MEFAKRKTIPDGEPCEHPGCLSHISHPCEGCGRIGGVPVPELPLLWRQYFDQIEAENERVRELEAALNEIIAGEDESWAANVAREALGGE